MAEEGDYRWGFVPRMIVAAFAAMVVSLAIKPYESKLTPYVNKIKEVSAKNVNLNTSDKELRQTSGDRDAANGITEEVIDSTQGVDKITDNDKSQLTSVFDNF